MVEGVRPALAVSITYKYIYIILGSANNGENPAQSLVGTVEGATFVRCASS